MWHGKVNTAVGVQGSLALGTTVSPQASSFLIKGGLITGLSFRGQDWAQKKKIMMTSGPNREPNRGPNRGPNREP